MSKKKVNSNEDKNLNGVMDSEEVVSVDGVSTSEAKGSETSEAAEATESEVEVSEETVASAEVSEESETEESVDEVVVEVEPLNVTLTFGKKVVKLKVTETFQLDLRKACQDNNSRYDEFEVDGDLDPQNLRLLLNALK